MSETVPLLPGEDPRSDLVDDMRHWVDVYTTLDRELEQLLRSVVEPGASLDRQRLEAQGRHVESRLRYWTERLRHAGGEVG
jgi:hypothetical protein